MREHSRAELERKLARHAVDDSAAPDAAEVGARITAVLDELAASGLLSEQRAAEALVTAQARRFGAAKLQQNLRLRGVAPEVAAAALATVKASEFERAEAVWRRRFGVPAQDPSDRARQARFLTARGFSADIVRRLVRGLIDD
ncbi:MAG: regulatory protein RecX [Burkholderiaceae bacterium]|nr:regulatory protein RecX [Burkholderiaceae bacterium]